MPAALDREALLAAVRAAPQDDLPRLLFADFLDEQGEAERSEFIRAQVELASMDERGEGAIDPDEGHTCWQSPCPVCALVARYEGLRRRERELLAPTAHWARWLHEAFDGLAHDVGVARASDGTLHVSLYDARKNKVGHFTCAFRRGFVASVILPCGDWLRHGAALVRACPLEGVRLSDREPQDFHNNSDNPGGHLFGFYGVPDDFEWATPHHVPQSLWVVLTKEEGCEVHGGWADFASEADARAALSRACLRLAREGGGP